MRETIDKITNFIFIPSTVKPVDIIIVLGNDYTKTMDLVANIYHEGYAKKILITGHSSRRDEVPESERFFRRAIQLGIPSMIFFWRIGQLTQKKTLYIQKNYYLKA